MGRWFAGGYAVLNIAQKSLIVNLIVRLQGDA